MSTRPESHLSLLGRRAQVVRLEAELASGLSQQAGVAVRFNMTKYATCMEGSMPRLAEKRLMTPSDAATPQKRVATDRADQERADDDGMADSRTTLRASREPEAPSAY